MEKNGYKMAEISYKMVEKYEMVDKFYKIAENIKWRNIIKKWKIL